MKLEMVLEGGYRESSRRRISDESTSKNTENNNPSEVFVFSILYDNYINRTV